MTITDGDPPGCRWLRDRSRSRLKRAEAAVPIKPFLNGERFDEETLRILGVAFEQTCAGLRVGDCDDDVRQALANKIIELAKTGERNPDLLCEAH
jgi:hypothetical protein